MEKEITKFFNENNIKNPIEVLKEEFYSSIKSEKMRVVKTTDRFTKEDNYWHAFGIFIYGKGVYCTIYETKNN